jgi:TetR/AcrR family transcriptional regulator, transcriptional repressor for nem operon
MRDPEATKKMILKTSGELFNTRGYKATSISHITDATGFTKGAIYKHFENKDALERETFSYLASQVIHVLGLKIKAEKTAQSKLEVIFTFFESYISNPPIMGGCPLLNVAIEADDAHPALRNAARMMLSTLRHSVTKILENGVKYGQLKSDTDCPYYATLIIASLEGAIMMSKLELTSVDIHHVCRHLKDLIRTISR